MTDKNIKRIVISALIAALYATLTIALAPISYLGVQFRISEIMVLLAFYKKDYIVGLTLGCFIANILGPNGAIDIILGTFATFISVWGIYLTGKYIKGKKSIWIASIWPTIFNGIIIGWMLNYVYGLPLVLSMGQVALGEFVIITIIGVPVFNFINKKYFGKLNIITR
ncbi:MAG: QueT transporter family protein [Clostridium perfringens]|uniref:QueT transporter family protein n=1 Tax=Clostridium perfringens TaxID=1502 RepID=UPI001DD958A5|nr:QueT transporter family protein [Clostridium perfringens]EGS5729268.1 QueT transporter family protein [Clostridium perfringens]EGT0693635.1 QueT transporter family protein [Clostridium perfringens]EHK2278741.1 QueT transporter family protein [Clostridium perfringens]EHK2344832.1 QueT transporter family protein [Clostridium perfringens]EJT6494974.1 QueT transporter family protein [Clostridium perfringens]